MQNDVQKQLIDDLAHLCDELATIPSTAKRHQPDSVPASHQASCTKVSNAIQPSEAATPPLTESDQCLLPLT
jgi:hypothetical protein